MGTLKIIEKDDRLFIESNVIKLPTEEKDPLKCGVLDTYHADGEFYLMGIAIQKEEVCFYSPDKSGGSITTPLRNLPNWKGHHLYFTSDEEIKKGDWVYSVYGFIVQVDRIYEGYLHHVGGGNNKLSCYKKIIATTDKSLTKIRLIDGLDRDGYKVETIKQEFCLPQPSHKFIKAFCKQGGFDKCLVEVENYKMRKLDSGAYYGYILREVTDIWTLKTDSHNTITIKPFVEKAYTQSEVEQILFNYANDQGLLSTKSDVEQFNSLIEDYL